MLRVSVTDNGIGIKKEDISKIFDQDRLYTTYGTGNEKGSGLGLIICREFVELNGGIINVESRENKGTTFSFTLPLKHDQ